MLFKTKEQRERERERQGLIGSESSRLLCGAKQADAPYIYIYRSATQNRSSISQKLLESFRIVTRSFENATIIK